MVLRSTGLINFAQGDMAMLGGVLTAVLAAAGLPAGFAVLAAVAICTVLNVGFYIVAIRPVAGASMAQVTLITIGFSICLRGAVIMRWGSDPMAVPALSGEAPMKVFGVAVLPQELWLIFVLVAITVLTGAFFRHTVTGLALRAGAANPLGRASSASTTASSAWSLSGPRACSGAWPERCGRRSASPRSMSALASH